MNENLVRRLRRLEAAHKKEWGGATDESCLIAEAADAIEKLSAQLERKKNPPRETRKRKESIMHVIQKNLQPGDKVIMNTKYYVSPENRGKVWKVRSDPWFVGETAVVLLCGRAGGYAVDGLDKVEE